MGADILLKATDGIADIVGSWVAITGQSHSTFIVKASGVTSGATITLQATHGRDQIVDLATITVDATFKTKYYEFWGDFDETRAVITDYVDGTYVITYRGGGG